MSKKHVQKSGIRAGQWVTCHAQYACRNQGVHVYSKELEYAKEYFADKGELQGKNPTAEQVKEFRDRYKKKPLVYRLSKIPKEDLSGIKYTYPQYEARNRASGEIVTRRRDTYAGAFAYLAEQAEKNDVLITLVYDDGTKEDLTPEGTEDLIARGKKNPHKRYTDIAHLELFGHRDNVVTVQEKYGCKLEKFR
jgi:hypothetical protein